MTNQRIRRAEPRDSRALSACIADAFSVYAERVTDLPPVAEGISVDIARGRVWVTEIDGKIVGGIILIPRDGFLQLANVAVHPGSAGLGLGRALIERAEAHCLELGLCELRLTTHVGIPENVRLYEHLGWQETRRAGNKVHMSRILPHGRRD